jgi:hypothetical protein
LSEENGCRFGGVVVSVLAVDPRFTGLNPVKFIVFRGHKNPQHTFLRIGSKAVSPKS